MEAVQSGKQPPARLNSDFWKYWVGQTISNLGSSITLFALPLLAGALVAIMSLQMLMLLDAASFLISAFSLALIKTHFNAKQEGTQERKNIGHDVIEGLRYVLGHPVLRNISIMMALVNFVASTV